MLVLQKRIPQRLIKKAALTAKVKGKTGTSLKHKDSMLGKEWVLEGQFDLQWCTGISITSRFFFRSSR